MKWTAADTAKLAKLYPHDYTKNVAAALGMSLGRVYCKAHSMGIKKSEAFYKKELRRQADRLNTDGNASRFQKGDVPHNKGKKVSAKTYKLMQPTMFKKGQAAYNTKPIGYERLSKDGYVEVRTRKGFRLKQRVVWEEHTGQQVPKGQIVVFRDGNSKNFDINNLELISRAENMRRNTIHRYPDELKSAMKQIGKLKKIINEKQA